MEKKTKKQRSIKEDKKAALHYMKTLTDVARESFLILDADLKVISGNPIFYRAFKVSSKETQGKSLYSLGNHQWNIPELKKLLEKILPDKKIVKDYEVSHNFESIGLKTMLLNAGQIDSVQLIILAIEDITDRKNLEKRLAVYTEGLEVKVDQSTKDLMAKVDDLETMNKTMIGRELKMVELKKEIAMLRKKIKIKKDKGGR